MPKAAIDSRSARGARRILILGSAFHIGGAERVIANLAKYIDSRRFHVTLGHLKEQGAIGAELAAQGFDVIGIPRAPRGLGKYLSFRNLSRLVRAKNIELIHTHTTYALTDATLCQALSNRGAKLVHTFHFGNYPHYPPQYKFLEYVCSRAAHRLVAVGAEQREIIRTTYKLPPERIVTIVNGVERPHQSPDAEWAARLGAGKNLVVGTICVCSEQKGLPDLLEAAAIVCARFPQVRFAVVGDGVLREAMEQRCREMGLAGQVIFTGWKRQADATMLPLFDVFFQPSVWEAMSMVVLEAMAAGKPVVATDVGDNRHVIRQGVTGLVVPKQDHEAMAAALTTLIESEELRAKYGGAARSRYEELYSARSMARAYEELYAEILADAG